MPPENAPLPLALVIAVASLWIVAVLLIVIKAWRRPPLLPYEPRQPVPWSANDLGAILLVVLALGYVAGETIKHFYPGQPAGAATVAGLYASSAVELASLVIGVVLMKFQAGASWADLGLKPSRLARDFGLGIVAFVASVAPICGLEGLLEKLFVYEQPLIEAVRAQPDAATFAATTVAAVVAAPLFEEFLFRVLLQGWFESIEARRRAARGTADTAGPAWWPILLSALFFSLLHLGQGPAPIPLFFFAIVLGYLYQRTHRIWPSLVTHFLLNAGTMVILWCQARHAGAS
jgi:membrane protease YdiL (CAAX protease family)